MLDPDDEQIIKECKEGGGILVTWDRVLLAASGGITPYEAMDRAKEESSGPQEAQAELSRLRKLSPAQLSVMADGADKRWNNFHEHIQLDRPGATLIRRLRVDLDYSWRAVARFSSWESKAPWGANQIAGMVICEKAAKLLGEDCMEPPWN